MRHTGNLFFYTSNGGDQWLIAGRQAIWHFVRTATDISSDTNTVISANNTHCHCTNVRACPPYPEMQTHVYICTQKVLSCHSLRRSTGPSHKSLAGNCWSTCAGAGDSTAGGTPPPPPGNTDSRVCVCVCECDSAQLAHTAAVKLKCAVGKWLIARPLLCWNH